MMMSRCPNQSDLPTTHRVFLETFGCQMNELDSELIVGQLEGMGYRFTDDWKQADIVLYNTCSVREHAEAKVYSRLGRVGSRKRDRPQTLLGVIGCMAERDGRDLLRRYPQVDLLCGPGELDKLPMLIDNALKTAMADDPVNVSQTVALQGSASRRSGTLAAAEDRLEFLDLSRRFNPEAAQAQARSAYVRITRGCNKFCTYCVVPFTRGAEIHRPPDHILDECRRLVEAGVVEITLLGQTVNHYRFEHGHAVEVHGVVQPQKGRSYAGGHDRDPFTDDGHTTTFAKLLQRIHEELPDLQRLRFVTSYPRDFGNDVLEVMRDCPRICRYLHVPVQSGSNRILEMMNRGYTVEEYKDFIERVRAYLPDAQLASDFIVGFPTETEEDFQASVELLTWSRFKNCFVFKYSPRPGTPAFDKMKDDISEEEKKRRNNVMLSEQAAISRAVHESYLGSTVEVFVEGVSSREARKQRRAARDGSLGGAVSLTVHGNDINSEVAPTMSDDETVQMSGRTSGDLITMFDVPATTSDSLIGAIVQVHVTNHAPLALFGELV
ncbi:MAG: radical SAM protein [Planctomycetes bacterium]|nr:radical SAM protein [Planctomycetota bacterium]NOG54973.1 radical SAM protein [Planctomycetota bacterium]